MTLPTRIQDPWSDTDLEQIEGDNPKGMTVQQIVETVTGRGERLTEATFRKYVQLGLLPRSVRVGRKGKHRGSLGLYPGAVVRQLLRIRTLMKQGFTIEEIQRRSLLLGGDIDALGGSLERVLGTVARACTESANDTTARSSDVRDMENARAQAAQLIDTLRGIEHRLTMHARMERAAV